MTHFFPFYWRLVMMIALMFDRSDLAKLFLCASGCLFSFMLYDSCYFSFLFRQLYMDLVSVQSLVEP